MSRFRDWLKAIKEAPTNPRSGATVKESDNDPDLYPEDIREAIEDTVYPQADEKDVEDADLCTYPENQCTCKNGIGCVNVPVEDW